MGQSNPKSFLRERILDRPYSLLRWYCALPLSVADLRNSFWIGFGYRVFFAKRELILTTSLPWSKKLIRTKSSWESGQSFASVVIVNICPVFFMRMPKWTSASHSALYLDIFLNSVSLLLRAFWHESLPFWAVNSGIVPTLISGAVLYVSKSLEHVQISAYWHLHRALYIPLLAHRSQTLGHDKFLPMTPHASNCHPYINEKSTFGSLHAFSSIQLCNTHIIDDIYANAFCWFESNVCINMHSFAFSKLWSTIP